MAQNARKREGRTRYYRTRTSSVPTMDGGWVRGDMFRVKATGVLVDGGDMERGRVATRIHPTQAGRVTSCFTRKHMQTPPTPVHGMRDADTLAGRGRGGRTRARWQDADKQRPYYGRGLGAWGHVPRKSDGCPGRWRGHGTWPGGNAHPSHPGRPGHVVFYAKTYANTTNARPWHAGRGHVGGTRARWQDAGAVAGRGRGGRTRTSSVPTMDGGWVRGDMFRVKATGVLVDGGD